MTNKNFKLINAFTLAEVLITLGIIGIVAAMTLPTLIQNYKKKAYATKAHKAYAEVLQAIKLSENDNGPVQNWDCVRSAQGSIDCVEKYIKPYYKDLSFCPERAIVCGSGIGGTDARYKIPSGVCLSFMYDSNNLYLMMDVNLAQPPNLQGIDAFYFNTINSKHLLLPYGVEAQLTREQILQGFQYNNRLISCKKSATEENELYRHGCTLLLYLDNWEIKDDYPWE